MSNLGSYSALALLLFLAFWTYQRLTRSPLKRLPLPPGPKPLPVIGNLLDIPKKSPWEAYLKWANEYDSDIIYVNVAGISLVILNTYEAAVELLERRFPLYSNRPRMPMVRELMGWERLLGFMAYGDDWRAGRRLFDQSFNARATKDFDPQITQVTHQFLFHLVEEPHGDVIQHIRRMTGKLILLITYGIPALPENDPYVATFEAALHAMMSASSPGAFLVNVIPWLKYVPSWFPGAGFQRKAKEWKGLTDAMIEKPFEAAKRQMANGNFVSSFTTNNLEMIDEESIDEQTIQSVAGATFSAGTDTTVATLATFTLAMLLYPEVQTKAQAELDGFLKPGHLPTLEDKASLPYVTALVAEVLRWRPVAPLGFLRAANTDDVYNGYRIPAGSMVVPNVWAMFMDKNMYPDPVRFNPDRFLKDGKPNPEVRDSKLVTFGFGRRICPGRHLAYSSIWLTVACMLATMNITQGMDEDGAVLEPSGEYENATMLIPKPFPCSIKPRSKDAQNLVVSYASMD